MAKLCPKCGTALSRTSTASYLNFKSNDTVLYCDCGVFIIAHGNTNITKSIFLDEKLYKKQLAIKEDIINTLSSMNLDEDAMQIHLKRIFNREQNVSIHQLDKKELKVLKQSIDHTFVLERHAIKTLINYHHYIREILKMKRIEIHRLDASAAYYNSAVRAQFLYDLYDANTTEEVYDLIEKYIQKERDLLCLKSTSKMVKQKLV